MWQQWVSSLNGPLTYVQHHITINVLSVSLNKTFPSFKFDWITDTSLFLVSVICICYICLAFYYIV